MKSDSLTLFSLATDILSPYMGRVTREEETLVDEHTLCHDVTDDETGKWIMSTHIDRETRVIKEIVYPKLRPN